MSKQTCELTTTLTSLHQLNYHDGQLKLYIITHLSELRGLGNCLEYIMTQLRSFSLTDTYHAFRQGASAF